MDENLTAITAGLTAFVEGVYVDVPVPAGPEVQVVVTSRDQLPWPAAPSDVHATLQDAYQAAVAGVAASGGYVTEWGVDDPSGGTDWSQAQYWLKYVTE